LKQRALQHDAGEYKKEEAKNMIAFFAPSLAGPLPEYSSGIVSPQYLNVSPG